MFTETGTDTTKYLSEAPGAGKSIYDYAMNSDGAKAYVALTKEVLDSNKEDGNE